MHNLEVHRELKRGIYIVKNDSFSQLLQYIGVVEIISFFFFFCGCSKLIKSLCGI